MATFGWIAFVLTQIFYLPQIIQILRTKNVSGLALPSWFILTASLLFYLVYSIWRHDIVFIVGNAAGTVQSVFMIALILKYRKKQTAETTETKAA